MRSIYKFVAGNSRVTPIGIALAVAIVIVLRGQLGWWAAPLYVAILLFTLAGSTAETPV